MNYRWFISPETQFCQLPQPVVLESGEVLTQVQVAYRTWGKLNAAGDNGVLICHALTGSADADSWWQPLFGTGKACDRQQDFMVCSNILGSCYGTTRPISVNPATGKPYGANFPAITIRDMVRVQAALLECLGVRRLKLVIGGSLGGMQVLEWALLYPEKVEAIAAIAVSGKHSAWCIGISEAQRQAIYADPLWQGGNYAFNQQPESGLAAARMMATITYRSQVSFEERFSRQQQADGEWAMGSYLQHQGQKFVQRFDANTYIGLTKAMDTHDLGRGRGDYQQALSAIAQPTLIVGIDSDILYPPREQQELAAGIPQAQLFWLPSLHGHDGFLIDMEDLNQAIVAFRAQESRLNSPPQVNAVRTYAS